MIRIPYTENTVGKVINTINDKSGLDLHSVKAFTPKIYDVAKHYLSGYSQKDTAEYFNICEGTVKNYFKRVYHMPRKDYIKKHK